MTNPLSPITRKIMVIDTIVFAIQATTALVLPVIGNYLGLPLILSIIAVIGLLCTFEIISTHATRRILTRRPKPKDSNS